MEHIFLTCKNHPHLRWMCKDIAFTEGHGYNGARNIFYLGTVQDTGWPEPLEPECSCPPTDLIRVEEKEL